MISFKEYLLRHVKGGAFFIIGLFIMLMAILFSVSFPEYPLLTWLFFIMGLICFGYGIYLINKLRYQRESEGYRVYHYRGRY